MAARVLIDGRSGSGKTEFAVALAAAWPGAQLVRLDDIYPGWTGLAAGSAAVHEQVLSEFRWRRWDWSLSERAEWHSVDPTLPILVEGCGALSEASRRLATFGIWVELDSALRKARALARDGEAYAPHWDDWAAQEEAFLASQHPHKRADLVVDGAKVVDEAERWRARIATGAG